MIQSQSKFVVFLIDVKFVSISIDVIHFTTSTFQAFKHGVSIGYLFRVQIILRIEQGVTFQRFCQPNKRYGCNQVVHVFKKAVE